MCDTTDQTIDTFSHVFSGLGSSSGVSSATSSSSASSLDRASTGSASSTSGQWPDSLHDNLHDNLHMCLHFIDFVKVASVLLPCQTVISCTEIIFYRLTVTSLANGKYRISVFFFANSLIFKKETSGKLMNESFAICELFLLVEKEFPMLEKFHICRTFDQVYISGLSSSPLGGGSFTSSNTKCPVCSGAFVSPKVLPCFHTFCQPCLERCQVGIVLYQLQSCVFHYPQKVLFKSKIKIF